MVVMLSLWRNDVTRDLEARAAHLLSKTSKHELRWLWITGDNSDETCQRLGDAVPKGMPVTIIDADTGIIGEDVETRRRRGSETATELFAHIEDTDDFACLHESDLRSEHDVVDQLLASGNGSPIAGWPTLGNGPRARFYDVWAYRDLRGRPFVHRTPYAVGYRPNGPFQVGSFGSVWLVPASLLKDRLIERRAVLELCEQWRAEGVTLLVDPRIAVVQPEELWP